MFSFGVFVFFAVFEIRICVIRVFGSDFSHFFEFDLV